MKINEKLGSRPCLEEWETDTVDGTELGQIMGRHRNTIERWRDTGLIPAACVKRWGTEVRYSLKQLEHYGLIRRRNDDRAAVVAATAVLTETVQELAAMTEAQLHRLRSVVEAMQPAPPTTAFIAREKDRS